MIQILRNLEFTKLIPRYVRLYSIATTKILCMILCGSFFGCDETRSCKGDEECSTGYYCDLEGYCTQLTAYVTCGNQRCFAPEICVNNQCMVIESSAGTEGGDIPLAGTIAGNEMADQSLDLAVASDMYQRDSFTYNDLEFRDMSLPQDMSPDPLDRDQGGQPCRNTCECSPGLGCVAGQCVASSSPVYCCDSAFCPPGEACQTAEGTRALCLDSACSTACDCDPGLSCINNACVLGDAPLFCCEEGTCPSGQSCEDRRGVLGMCPSETCYSACDCPTGQRCVNGSCLLQGDPIFCCDQGSCPAGAACQNTEGELALCQGEIPCQSACDCMPGMSCVDGSCALGNQPIFCCEDSFCPSGERCESQMGGPLMLCTD